MKTENLITALATDLPTRPVSPARALVTALFVSIPIACGLLVYALQVRPDIVAAMGTARFDFKLMFMVSLALAALWLAGRLSRPGANARPALLAVGATFALLAAAVGLEMAALPSSAWMPALVGNMAKSCVTLIPLMSLAPLAVILLALRAGAPDNTAAAGGAAGLLAGAIGATFYAPHCTNDSPLYIAGWYLIGIAAVTLAGSLIGKRLLRW